MNKKTFLWILLDGLFLVIFDVLFFSIGGSGHPASVWISFILMHAAFALVIATPFLVKNKDITIFTVSLYTISSVYFLIEFIVGLIFVLIRQEDVKAALIVQIIIAGAYGIILIASLLISENLEKKEQETAYVKIAATKVKALMDKSDNKKANREIERAYDVLNSSPAKTHPSVSSVESSMLNKVSELEDAVYDENDNLTVTIARELVKLAEDRNKQLKSVK